MSLLRMVVVCCRDRVLLYKMCSVFPPPLTSFINSPTWLMCCMQGAHYSSWVCFFTELLGIWRVRAVLCRHHCQLQYWISHCSTSSWTDDTMSAIHLHPSSWGSCTHSIKPTLRTGHRGLDVTGSTAPARHII